MIESIPFLISGTFLGLAAGIAPGPLLTLVITETLRHSRKEGITVASVPILTDLPIIAASAFALSKLSQSDIVLGMISFAGAAFISYLGYESVTVQGFDLDVDQVNPQSLQKGLVTNFLNPHPYLFWMTVGTPIILKAYGVNLFTAIAFVALFYVFLIGSKIVVALVVDKSKTFLSSRTYVYAIRVLGLALFVFALIFVRDGLRLLSTG